MCNGFCNMGFVLFVIIIKDYYMWVCFLLGFVFVCGNKWLCNVYSFYNVVVVFN